MEEGEEVKGMSYSGLIMDMGTWDILDYIKTRRNSAHYYHWSLNFRIPRDPAIYLAIIRAADSLREDTQ